MSNGAENEGGTVKFPLFQRTDTGSLQGAVQGKTLATFRTIYGIYRNFTSHQGPMRAAALTYTTVLSLVPFLAIAFSVLKGLGAQNSLEPMIQNIAGDSREMVSRIIAYVNNTNMKSLGAIGLIMLIVTVISLMESIEVAFNAVWGVRETRSLQRRFSDYLSVVVVGPILLVAATSMTSSLQSQWLLQWLIVNTYLGDAILLLFRFLPYLSVWVAMTFLYMFIPNIRVRFVSAVTGGVVAGTAWQLAQWGYFHFQVGVANYNAIYGTLAAVPVFLVWVYTSWLIVLMGLEIVAAHQHHGVGGTPFVPLQLSAAGREVLSVALLLHITGNFVKGSPPPVSDELAVQLGVPLLPVQAVLEELASCGYVVPVAGTGGGWLPARDPGEIQVNDILDAVRGTAFPGALSPAVQRAAQVVAQRWRGGLPALERLSLRELLEKSV